MTPLRKLLADIDEDRATMADVENYIAESAAASAHAEAETKRLFDAHAAMAQKRAIESALHGRSRISYALRSRK